MESISKVESSRDKSLDSQKREGPVFALMLLKSYIFNYLFTLKKIE